jgi:hypothetical protein
MNKAPITGYTELPASEVADGDMIEIVDVSEAVDADKNKKLSLKGYVAASTGKKVYKGLVSQVAGYAPTDIILENTLGDVPVWTLNSIGRFYLTLVGAFPIEKTWYIRQLESTLPKGSNPSIYMYRVSADVIGLSSKDSLGASVEGVLSNTPFLIEVNN